MLYNMRVQTTVGYTFFFPLSFVLSDDNEKPNVSCILCLNYSHFNLCFSFMFVNSFKNENMFIVPYSY